MIRHIALDLLALCIVPALALASTAAHLSERDNGRTVTLRQGSELTVSLRQNVTTGYSWRVISAGEPVIVQVGEPTFVPDSELHGAGGTVTFRFRAAEAGTASLKLAYVRPWEKDAKPAAEFAATIVVEK
jgi:inhibitor of cysteine peptidase